MKKLISVILCLSITVALFAGCSGKAGETVADTDAEVSAAEVATDTMPTKLSTTEYTLYQNIFYNDQSADYNGKEVEKEGTFATLYDAYNGVTRYYVWGYNDQTKCCDWQWELNLDKNTKLPSNGSLIKVSGVYEINDGALDDLWIANPAITVETAYQSPDYDVNMLAMDDTLERVQIANITQKADEFEGKTVCLYGRILDGSTLQDPYYDGSWTIGISGDFEVPAFGTIVCVYGTVTNGGLTNCTLAENTQY